MRGKITDSSCCSTSTATRNSNTLSRHTFADSPPSPQPPTTGTGPFTRTGTREASCLSHTFNDPPSPLPPAAGTSPSITRTGTRTANSSRHDTTTPSTRAKASARTIFSHSKPPTTSRSTRKNSPLITDSEASPSKDTTAPVEPLANASPGSPLETAKKTKKKRKKINCSPPQRRQPVKRTITEIQRKTNVTPGVRRSKRPHIGRVPFGGYVEYEEHWGNTPSKAYGREALSIVNPLPIPSPRSRNATNKRTRDEEECYLSIVSPDDSENVERCRFLFPLSHGQLCNADGMDVQPGDDLIINRLITKDDYQIGEMDFKKGAEKPMAQNENCEMIFRVLKGKILVVFEDGEVEMCTNEYIRIPPGAVYQLNNIARSNTVLNYTFVMKL
ncbi:PREDICTED: uncharacterized protein LOC109586159 [Amphimedon queenslandica]|uniref:Mif2/CENP-C cupin domain-containing protein n=1 Tax=Amphimedon queenslandica TaxID=400682 RepID=A0AAN0JM98_AMPQE|nr:PREDICTED: uncharacterized protein LOC109586159 [Amphimedon queenslandica]|eukprot:XP_019857892.1 PREDICTED: uncharacterized protein LOC109586159 [Amphimedon queenslandica]